MSLLDLFSRVKTLEADGARRWIDGRAPHRKASCPPALEGLTCGLRTPATCRELPRLPPETYLVAFPSGFERPVVTRRGACIATFASLGQIAVEAGINQRRERF